VCWKSLDGWSLPADRRGAAGWVVFSVFSVPAVVHLFFSFLFFGRTRSFGESRVCDIPGQSRAIRRAPGRRFWRIFQVGENSFPDFQGVGGLREIVHPGGTSFANYLWRRTP
jgi:hypothetical protein